MDTSTQQLRNALDSTLLRWFGRVAGMVLFVVWMLFVVRDIPYQDAHWGIYLQAGGLAIVFAGYLAGWWNELVGGVTTIVGTAVFVAMCVFTTQDFPRAETLLFAAPGICYLLARHFARIENLGASHET